jgi:hypothetical protein
MTHQTKTLGAAPVTPTYKIHARLLANVFEKSGRSRTEAMFTKLCDKYSLKRWEMSALSNEFRIELNRRGIDPLKRTKP